MAAASRWSLGVVSAWVAWVMPSWALAQVAVEPQPDVAGLVRQAQALRSRGKLNEKSLLALKPGKVDGALAFDLQSKDWLAVGAWSYPEAKFNVGYTQANACQLDIVRYHSDHGEMHFSVGDLCQDPSKAQLRHTNFQVPLPVKVAVTGSGAQTWLAIDAYGKREWQRVVAYHDGALVIDITQAGTKTDKVVKFRELRLAMPRLFSFTPAPPPAKAR